MTAWRVRRAWRLAVIEEEDDDSAAKRLLTKTSLAVDGLNVSENNDDGTARPGGR